MAKAQVTYSTISARTVFRALHTPGGPVYEWSQDTAKMIVREARATVIINDVRNTLRPGHAPPGRYMAGWYWKRARGSNGLYLTVMEVGNTAPHAALVEEGKPFVRKRQIFTWSRGLEINNAFFGTEFERNVARNYEISARQVRAWPGRHVLGKATSVVAAKRGIRVPRP